MFFQTNQFYWAIPSPRPELRDSPLSREANSFKSGWHDKLHRLIITKYKRIRAKIRADIMLKYVP